ncbi:hypothetical protein JOD45_001347 [Scopulibacillus daqui]|uniref:Glycosyl hydrolase n=1 Tax=Scopulibacillus daqui TaxID=1469162 RepID=A0ABS2PYK5_9BACL|nr:hypothetical protein [Scopulibacillus daqui]MBM7645136.1 hypothetical protein [Scopulibacillus daqui]
MTNNPTANGSKKGFGGLFVIVIVFIAIIVALFLYLYNGSQTKTMTFNKIYGLGYTNNGQDLYIPVQDGVEVYNKGNWKKLNADKNNYLGFAASNDGFYGSGHPGKDSKHPNPLGLIKVTNKGKDIKTLGFSKETYFQHMAVGYYSHAIYVFNPHKNSKMPSPGLYYSLNDGKSWVKSAAKGLKGEPQTIAVHPKKENIVAVGTNEGLFLSKDYGKTFKLKSLNKNITSLWFGFDGYIYAGAYTNESELDKVDLKSDNVTPLDISSVEQDPIKYIAQNPKDPKQMTYSTQSNAIYTTESAGQNWVVLAKGQGLSGK